MGSCGLAASWSWYIRPVWFARGLPPFPSWWLHCLNLEPIPPLEKKKTVDQPQIHLQTHLGPSLGYRAWMTVILPLEIHRDTWYLDLDPLPPR